MDFSMTHGDTKCVVKHVYSNCTDHYAASEHMQSGCLFKNVHGNGFGRLTWVVGEVGRGLTIAIGLLDVDINIIDCAELLDVGPKALLSAALSSPEGFAYIRCYFHFSGLSPISLPCWKILCRSVLLKCRLLSDGVCTFRLSQLSLTCVS